MSTSDWLDDKMRELGKFPCPECDEYISSIGHHWGKSPSCRPEIKDKQHEVITGLLMGDGSLNTHNGEPYLQVGMISESYLHYLDECVFPAIGRGVNLYKTAKESAESLSESKLPGSGNVDNYNDIYFWRTSNHHELRRYECWYNSGNKVWPKNIDLTPVTLKHWYCGDGNYNTHGTNRRISIAMANERENTDKVDEMFKRASLPQPNNYYTYQRDSGGYVCQAQFTVEQSQELFDYMGEPLPDFEYKWPQE